MSDLILPSGPAIGDRVSLAHSGYVTIPAGVGANVYLPFGAEQIDEAGVHDDVVNNSRIEIPVGSKYNRIKFNSRIRFQRVARWADSHIVMYLAKNRASYTENDTHVFYNSTAQGFHQFKVATDWLECVPGDYWELHVVNVHASATYNMLITAAANSYFSAELMKV